MPTITTRGAMSARGFGFGYKSAGVAAGSQSYTTPGTYTWVAPAGVTSVSVVAVGGGGRSVSVYATQGGGGALGYKNNYSVTPGTSYTVVVGTGPSSGCANGGDTYFINTSIVKGGGGRTNCRTAATFVGGGGGNGGLGGCSCACTCTGGGGGAGGYSGAGGNGYSGATGASGTSGSGGGGAGGGASLAGGGVGISSGQGSNGTYPQGGGSGGSNGAGTSGGAFGGGGAGSGGSNSAGSGALRIVWPGATRQFPSTCVGSP